jgi:C4-dicarboxylate transporter DctQ subunit
MDRVARAIELSNRWIRWICIFCSGAIFILVMAQILFRYVIKISAPWTEEAARYLMIWMALLAAGLAFQKGHHFNIDFVTSRLRARTQKQLSLFTAFLTSIFILCIILWGIPFATLGFFTISPGLEITMFLPYLAIPVAGVVMMLNLIMYIRTLMGKKGKGGP